MDRNFELTYVSKWRIVECLKGDSILSFYDLILSNEYVLFVESKTNRESELENEIDIHILKGIL